MFPFQLHLLTQNQSNGVNGPHILLTVFHNLRRILKMYIADNRVPAPYEIGTPQPNTVGAYSKGGRTSKHKGMTKVHLNPMEVRIMDHVQGFTEHGPGGVKMYPHLEELLKNRHLVETIHRHHHASGGYSPAMERLRAGGRHGDSEIAMIGPRTEHLFNTLAGHPTKNPYTGHPEYFSIGPALSGLWNTVSGAAPSLFNAAKGLFSSAAPALKDIAQSAAPSLLPMATDYLKDKFGDVGQLAGNLGSQYIQSSLGAANENSNPYYQAIGQGIGTAAQNYRSGATPSQSFGGGLNTFGTQIGGGIGNALQSTGQALNQGQGWGQAGRAGSQRFSNELGGRQGVLNAGRNMGGLQGGWGGAQQAFNNQMNQYAQRAMPQPRQQQQQQFPMSYPQQQQEEYYPDELYG
jgi:hypothetical protein